jgi:hypothetical protein
MAQRGQAAKSTSHTQKHDTQKAKYQRGKERSFFQQMQPTFAVEVPKRVTRLEFLDERDPRKDTIVRKKAREWVNQNKVNAKKSRPKQQQTRVDEARDIQPAEFHGTGSYGWTFHEMVTTCVPLAAVGHTFDPFNSLPNVGTKYDHILDYCESVSSL